jgi:hypothetical protein
MNHPLRLRATFVAVGLVASTLALAQSAIVINGNEPVLALRVVEGTSAPIAYRTGLRAGGSVDLGAQRLPSGCAGFAQRIPHYIVRFRRSARNLRVYVTSATDTTLVVNAPDGRWHCNDNWGRTHNPMIEIPAGPSGQYDIWVAAKQPNTVVQTTLFVTENPNAHP